MTVFSAGLYDEKKKEINLQICTLGKIKPKTGKHLRSNLIGWRDNLDEYGNTDFLISSPLKQG